MLGFIITMIIVGLIAGFLARAIVPGRQSMSGLATIVLGIIGSFVGGFLGYLLFHKDASQGALQPSGIIGSIPGGIVALLIYPAPARPGSPAPPSSPRPPVTSSRGADACPAWSAGPDRPAAGPAERVT